MTNVVRFPGRTRVVVEAPKKVAATAQKPRLAIIGGAAIKGLWVVTVLLWPLLKLVISLDCVYQLGRMLYYWNTPGVYAGWTFLMHFAVLTALTFFVAAYKPKGL